MIVYELVCRQCTNVIDHLIDEMTFLRNLMEEERVICSHCGHSFINEDSDYRGKKED
jgi:hypothetical protein